MDYVLLSFIPAALLALTHIVLHFVEIKIYKKAGWHWLSLFSGISVSYVFLGLIPDIEKYKYNLNATSNVDEVIDSRFYAILILAGFTLFYSIEIFVKHHRKRITVNSNLTNTNHAVDILLPCQNNFILVMNVVIFSAYDFIISFLLPKKLKLFGAKNMWFYYVAMQAHFIVDDMSLHEHFGKRYDKYGRIPLVLCTIGGSIVGYFVTFPVWLIATIASFIAGGTIINIIKEELPAKSKGPVPLFLIAVVSYSILIILLY